MIRTEIRKEQTTLENLTTEQFEEKKNENPVISE